jgi:hypothetical protein
LSSTTTTLPVTTTTRPADDRATDDDHHRAAHDDDLDDHHDERRREHRERSSRLRRALLVLPRRLPHDPDAEFANDIAGEGNLLVPDLSTIDSAMDGITLDPQQLSDMAAFLDSLQQ